MLPVDPEVRRADPSASGMSSPTGPFAGAGALTRTEEPRHPARRVVAWLVWWVLLMAFWVWIDDSLLAADLGIGAAVAAAGAALVELAQYQARSHIRLRSDWLGHAVTLPWQVLRDTGVVFAALARRVLLGEEPPSAFLEIPVSWGDDSDEGTTRRALIVAATSLAPNTFALGIDESRQVMVVHRLVAKGAGTGGGGDD